MMPSICDIETIFFIDCSEAELEARILNRGLTSNRNEDNLITAKKRFLTFTTETLPVIEYFEKNPAFYKFVRIDGSQSKEKVYMDIKSALEPVINSTA